MNAMALEQALMQEQERAAVTAAIAKLTEICFDKCVAYPDAKLSNSEVTCIKNTTGRYLDTSMFVVGRLMRQGGGNQEQGH
jgi:import inner membrane translocase subunit TIM8